MSDTTHPILADHPAHKAYAEALAAADAEYEASVERIAALTVAYEDALLAFTSGEGPAPAAPPSSADVKHAHEVRKGRARDEYERAMAAEAEGLVATVGIRQEEIVAEVAKHREALDVLLGEAEGLRGVMTTLARIPGSPVSEPGYNYVRDLGELMAVRSAKDLLDVPAIAR